MAAIARFVRLDLLSLRPQLRSICFLFVFVLALCAIQQTDPSLAVACIASAGAFFLPQFLFAHDEVGRLNTLYSILGVSRRAVVIGRYLTCFILTLVMLAASLLVTSLVGIFLNQSLNLHQLIALFLLCIFGTSLLLAINLPSYFTFGVVKARLIGIACTAALLTATVACAQHLPKSASKTALWLAGDGLSWLIGLSLGLTAGVLLLSSALTTRLYSRRDL